MPLGVKRGMYSYEYPKVADITADIAILTRDLSQILLILRKGEPYKGCWALPGGFLEVGESAEQAAVRELEEETSIKVAHLEQFRSFDTPGRDPRGPVLSVVHYHLTAQENVRPKAQDDAEAVGWFPTAELPMTAFDHYDIIKKLLDFLSCTSLVTGRCASKRGC